MSRSKVRRVLTRLLRAAALLVCPFAVQAGDISLKLQPGLAVPLSTPRPQSFGTGSAELQALLGLGRYFDLELGLGFVGLPMSSEHPSPHSSTASTFGVGLRLKRPRDQLSFHGASPWVEAEALYVHSSHLEGAGFATSAGIAFPLGRTREFWVGPFVRYLDVFQPNRTGLVNRDSSTISAGLTFEIVLSH